MTITQTAPSTASGPVDIGDVNMWVERRGTGPDVLLIAGLSDPAEAWQFQLDGLAGPAAEAMQEWRTQAQGLLDARAALAAQMVAVR